MAQSITSINSLLIGLKTVNSSLLVKLQQLGFDANLSLGPEQEYTVKSLISGIDSLAIQFLTLTAKRNQFIQRTSFNERKEIEACLNNLYNCLSQTQQELVDFNPTNNQCDREHALSYINEFGQKVSLKLLDAVHYIDLIKPYSRMLDMLTAHERIHALSAVLETLLSKEQQIRPQDHDAELTEEQTSALELSQYLIRQAL